MSNIDPELQAKIWKRIAQDIQQSQQQQNQLKPLAFILGILVIETLVVSYGVLLLKILGRLTS